MFESKQKEQKFNFEKNICFENQKWKNTIMKMKATQNCDENRKSTEKLQTCMEKN